MYKMSLADVRVRDNRGWGLYGTRRTGGRVHKGVDFLYSLGDPVLTPISGRITKIGWPYADDPHYRYVEVTHPINHWRMRFMYVRPFQITERDILPRGALLGFAQQISKRYPPNARGTMHDHVHVECYNGTGQHIDPYTVLYPSEAPIVMDTQIAIPDELAKEFFESIDRVSKIHRVSVLGAAGKPGRTEIRFQGDLLCYSTVNPKNVNETIWQTSANCINKHQLQTHIVRVVEKRPNMVLSGTPVDNFGE